MAKAFFFFILILNYWTAQLRPFPPTLKLRIQKSISATVGSDLSVSRIYRKVHFNTDSLGLLECWCHLCWIGGWDVSLLKTTEETLIALSICSAKWVQALCCHLSDERPHHWWMLSMPHYNENTGSSFSMDDPVLTVRHKLFNEIMCNRGSDSLKNTFPHAFVLIIPYYIAICQPNEIIHEKKRDKSIIFNLGDDILYGIPQSSVYGSSRFNFSEWFQGNYRTCEKNGANICLFK